MTVLLVALLAMPLGPFVEGAVLVAAAAGDSPIGSSVSIAAISAGLSALAVVLSGKIVVPTFAYQREKERADKWEAEALRQSAAIIERHIPALDAAAHAVAESSTTLARALEALGKRH